MKEQLTYLLQLQTIDTRVKELEAMRAAAPSRLEPIRRDLAKLEGMLSGERSKIAETETWQKQQRDLLDREQEALRSAKQKLQGSKTGKEYNAASREVDYKRKSITDREAELKKVSEGLSTGSAVITERDSSVEALRQKMATDEAEVATRIEDLSQKILETAAGRDALREKIDRNWLKTYDSLYTRRGFAVSAVLVGTCQGCQMRIPPQLNNILARMESLEMCPRCGRIIYRKEMLDPPAEPATPAE